MNRVVVNLLEADRSTIPNGKRHASHSEDEACVAIHWVHPQPRRPTPLIESHVFVGRAATSQIRLEGGSISRRHVEIYRQGPIFAIRDLGSTNGTYLNGSRVAHAALSPGDVLRVGDYIGIVGTVPSRRDAVSFGEHAPGMYGGERLATVIETARRAATSELPMILLGETGVGKDLLARAVHYWSGRLGQFCILDCGSLLPEATASSSFGIADDAADEPAKVTLSLIRQAQGGTLLLDEVGELSLTTQARLRHVLAAGTAVHVGQLGGSGFGVRVLVTSQRNLADLVSRGVFRNDLMARLCGTSIELPPLRERREDIAPLFRHFLARYYGEAVPACTVEFAEALCLYAWPRNIRELDTLAHQIHVLYPTRTTLDNSSLPPAMVTAQATPLPQGSQVATSDRREHDLRLLIAELHRNQGNVKAAAAVLGFSRQRAYRLMTGRGTAELLALATRGPKPTESTHAKDGPGRTREGGP